MRKSPALVLAAVAVALLSQQCGAAPIRYDQRQDGDQNVDARLQNFFVVVSPSAQQGISLLDLASKAVPLRLRPQGLVQSVDGLKQREEPQQEVRESKGARAVAQPNAMAIPVAILQSPLAKLHPEVQALSVEEVLIARSPAVALRAPGAAPGAVPMLVAVPVPEVAPERPAAPPALLPMHPAPPSPLGDKVDSAPLEVAAVAAVAAPEAVAAPDPEPARDAAVPAVETNQIESVKLEPEPEEASKVHLIGTGIEECGPERIRNEEGVCVDAAPRD